LPVRLSVTVRDSPPPTCPSTAAWACVSVLMIGSSSLVLACVLPHCAGALTSAGQERLLAALPAAAEQAAQAPGLRVGLVLGRSPLVGGQRGGLARVDRQRDALLGDPGHPGRVDEAVAAGGVHDDPVEDLLALVVEHAVHDSQLD